MKKCPACNSSIPNAVKACRRCGFAIADGAIARDVGGGVTSKLEKDVMPAPLAPIDPDPTNRQRLTPRPNRSKPGQGIGLGAVFIAVLAVSGLAVGSYALFSQVEPESGKPISPKDVQITAESATDTPPIIEEPVRPVLRSPSPEAHRVILEQTHSSGIVSAKSPPVASASPAAQPINRAPSEDISGRALSPPRYPPKEFRRGIGGTVILRVSIDAEGQVLDVAVQTSSRNRNLDRAAMDAARRWRFKAGIQNGEAVGGDVLVPVTFNPSD